MSALVWSRVYFTSVVCSATSQATVTFITYAGSHLVTRPDQQIIVRRLRMGRGAIIGSRSQDVRNVAASNKPADVSCAVA